MLCFLPDFYFILCPVNVIAVQVLKSFDNTVLSTISHFGAIYHLLSTVSHLGAIYHHLF